MKHMDSKEVAEFEADKGAGKNAVKTYGSGTGSAKKTDL